MKASITQSSNEMGTTTYILQRLPDIEDLSSPSSHGEETVVPGMEGNKEDKRVSVRIQMPQKGTKLKDANRIIPLGSLPFREWIRLGFFPLVD